jgi:dTDP-4-dehydrorhamnose reductase
MDAGLVPVFFSTDYVFDGTRGRWLEEDHPRPRTAYGAQKLAVEAWLGAVERPWLIARFSKIVGADPATHSVLGQWAQEIKAGKKQMLAADQIFSPTWIDDACGALIKLAESGATGTFHVANSEPMGRLALFELLLGHMQARDPSLRVEIVRALLHDLPFFSEKRPLDTSLANDKLQRVAPWRFRAMDDLCAEIARDALA